MDNFSVLLQMKGFFPFKDDQDEELTENGETTSNEQDEIASAKNEETAKPSQQLQQKQPSYQEFDEEVIGKELLKEQGKCCCFPDSSVEKSSKRKQNSFLKTFCEVTLAILLQLIFNQVLVYPILIISGLIFALISLRYGLCGDFKLLLAAYNYFQQVVFTLSVIYICYFSIQILFTDFANNIYSNWFLDCFFLWISHTMIVTIIQMTKNDHFGFSCGTISNCDNFMTQSLVIAAIDLPSDVIIDIPLVDDQWVKEYLRIITEVYEAQVDSQRFNTFSNSIKNLSIKQYIGYQLFKDQNRYLSPHMGQYFGLQFVALLKIICCVSYIGYHQKTFGWTDALHIIFITLFTINEIYCMSYILSNYDLRRKTLLNENINSAIVISGQDIDPEKVIDITDYHSIETWDNCRRAVYEFFSDMQHKLERSYICLFIYYLFITTIILTAYGEIYIVLSQDSILLHPLSVISSTFTFVILNMLILYRIYFGTKYNETLDDVGDKVDIIIGIYNDLIQQYDYHFAERNITSDLYINLEQRMQEMKEKEHKDEDTESAKLVNTNGLSESMIEDMDKQVPQLKYNHQKLTCYDILVSKFKYLSEYYIKNKVKFLGKLYNQEEEVRLQQKLMKNCLSSFERIKKQILIDQNQKRYKVLNSMQLDFQESFMTIVLGLATLLPSIITKFMDQFKTLNPINS